VDCGLWVGFGCLSLVVNIHFTFHSRTFLLLLFYSCIHHKHPPPVSKLSVVPMSYQTTYCDFMGLHLKSFMIRELYEMVLVF